MKQKVQVLVAAMSMAATVAIAQPKPYTIKGNIAGKSNGFIYLQYQDEAKQKKVEDSARIVKGTFTFQGSVDGVVQAYVAAEKNVRGYDGYFQVLLSPGNLKMDIDSNDFSNGTLSGTKVQEEMNVLNKLKAPLMVKLKVFNEAYNKANMAYSLAVREKKDSATLATLKEAANAAKDATGPLIAEFYQKEKAFMELYPASYATATILRGSINSMPLAQAKAGYAKLAPDVKESQLGKVIGQEIQKLAAGSPGAVAADFASAELRGEQLRLSSYKGQYVLLDFWASWCVPCRKGNPHLLSLYAKYKEKGLEIIGISDDDGNKDAWLKAVEKDQIGVWKHVLRGLKRTASGGFDRSTDISENYGIHTLPTKILIGPDGTIIGRYGGGGENDEAMDKKLAEIFKS